MPPFDTPPTALQAWKTILGNADLGHQFLGRDLWPVTAEDGGRYFLKRLGRWRNLPLADEARILQYVARRDVPVAGFLLSDNATLYTGDLGDPFILMPRLDNDRFRASELVDIEETIGRALAELHLALAAYPWPANSYNETLSDALMQDLMLTPGIADLFAERRLSMAEALMDLPTQLIHGDMTPENVLVRRPGEVSGFIDFDHLPYGPRIWDIAKYLSRRIRLRWRQGSFESSPGRLDYLAGFLTEYHAISPLRPAEIEALPAAIAAGNVLEVSYHMEISAGTLPRRRLPDHDEVLADAVEAASWHLEHYGDVNDAVQSSFG